MPTTFIAQVNPLRCIPIDLPQPGEPATPDAAKLLDYLLAPDAERTTDAFVRRYREVAAVAAAFPVAPAERSILQKLLWPLRHAIGSYCLADYLGCVALSGMVGEMVAILLWEISRDPRENPSSADQGERRLFGSKFEKLSQERRIDVLRGYRLIDGETEAAFDKLRTIRRRYLHLLSQPHDSLEADAREALDVTAKLVTFLLGLSIPRPGVVALRPELMAYVAARTPTHETAAGQSSGESKPPDRA